MITGHFGLAVDVRKFAPLLPLWSLLIATFWLDILFTVFSIFGLESFALMNPANPAYGEVIINVHYTHSLAGALVISLFTGWVASLHWKKQGGSVIGAVVFSHWILDLLLHRPDLPILPGNLGNLPLLGLGLWQYPQLSGAMELVLAVGGVVLYWVGVAKLKSVQRRCALTASLITGALLFTLFVVNVMGL